MSEARRTPLFKRIGAGAGAAVAWGAASYVSHPAGWIAGGAVAGALAGFLLDAVTRETIRRAPAVAPEHRDTRATLRAALADRTTRGLGARLVEHPEDMRADLQQLWIGGLRGSAVRLLCDPVRARSLVASSIDVNALSSAPSRAALASMLRALAAESTCTEVIEALRALAGPLTLADATGVTSAGEARKVVGAVYERLAKPWIAQAVAQLDPRALVQAAGAPGGLADEPSLRRLAARLVRETVRDRDRVKRLHAAIVDAYAEVVLVSVGPLEVTIGQVAGRAVTPDLVQRQVSRAADRLEKPSDSAARRIQAATVELAVGGTEAWRAVPDQARLQATQLVLDRVAPILVDALAGTLHEGLAATRVADALAVVITPEALGNRFRAAADWIADAEDPAPFATRLEPLRTLARAWIDAWSALDEGARRGAAATVVDALAPALLDALADAVPRELATDEGARGLEALGGTRWIDALADAIDAHTPPPRTPKNVLAQVLDETGPGRAIAWGSALGAAAGGLVALLSRSA